MIIKLFTMVKNEVDIVEDWLKYHGTLFGYHNLNVIDNMSDDGTYEKLQEYVKKGIRLSRELDYTKKGDYMNKLIHNPNHDKYDIAYPIDIDEFIVYYDKEQNKLLPFKTVGYLNSLNLKHNVFKANYIQAQISNGSINGYTRATIEAKYGKYDDYKDMAKTFFNKHTWNGEIDHGNHYCTQDYFMTDVCLVHYHCRNLDQMKAKVVNNVKGLGYDAMNIEKLQENLHGCGNHHVKHMISILNNTFSINTNFRSDNPVILKPLSTFIGML